MFLFGPSLCQQMLCRDKTSHLFLHNLQFIKVCDTLVCFSLQPSFASHLVILFQIYVQCHVQTPPFIKTVSLNRNRMTQQSMNLIPRLYQLPDLYFIQPINWCFLKFPISSHKYILNCDSLKTSQYLKAKTYRGRFYFHIN